MNLFIVKELMYSKLIWEFYDWGINKDERSTMKYLTHEDQWISILTYQFTLLSPF